MKYREFLSMTDDEVRQIITDLFQPQKITCIKRSKKWGEITCNIYTEWDPEDPVTIKDELTMRDPFSTANPLSVDFSVSRADYEKYTKFCAAKGMYPWLKDNPYL